MARKPVSRLLGLEVSSGASAVVAAIPGLDKKERSRIRNFTDNLGTRDISVLLPSGEAFSMVLTLEPLSRTMYRGD
jgi:K+-transporting ATPase A subunit